MVWSKSKAKNGHYCIVNMDVGFSESIILERELERIFKDRFQPSHKADIVSMAEEMVGEVYIDNVLLKKGYDILGVSLLAIDDDGDAIIEEFKNALDSALWAIDGIRDRLLF